MNSKISYQELIDAIASKTGQSKQEIRKLFTGIRELVHEELNENGSVKIPGMGKIYLKWQKPRTGKNPRTGENIEIPAQNTVHFKPENSLKTFINRNFDHLQTKVIMSEEKKTKADSIRNRKMSPWWLLILIIPILIVAMIIWGTPWQKEEPVEPIKKEAAAVEKDTLKQVKPEPVKEEKPVETEKKEDDQIPESYTLKKSERLAFVAEKYYKQRELWPAIYLANINTYPNPDSIPLGATVNMPDFEGKPGNFTDEDLYLIAEGNLKVYLAYKEYQSEKALEYLWVALNLGKEKLIQEYGNLIDPKDKEFMENIEGVSIIK